MQRIPFVFDQQQHVAAFLNRYPSFRQVLDSAGVNASAVSLEQPLAQCCAQSDVSAEELLLRFSIDHPEPRPADDRDWTEATLDELVHYLVSVHHDYVRVQLDRMQVLLNALVGMVPRPSERLDRARSALSFLAQRWHSHMSMEESEFFPACINLDTSRDFVDPEELDSLVKSLHRTSHDHREINVYADRLEQAIDAARDDLGTEAIPVISALDRALQDFIDDAREHSAKEDDILIPAVLFAHDVRRSDSDSGRFSRMQ